MQPSATATEIGAIVKHGRHRKARRIVMRIVWGALAVLVVFAIGRWWRDRGKTPPPEYQTAAFAREDLTVAVTATGTLEARNVVAVGSEVSGRIARVLVDDNARVTRGQVLAEIDPEILSAQLEQARAAREQAAAQVIQARATKTEVDQRLVRDRDLNAKGIVSDENLEATVAAAKRGDAALALAKANLRQAVATERVASTNLTKTKIRSPIDGIVLSHAIEEGQTVVAAFQTPVLFQIAEDLRELQLSVDVDEADIGKVREGQRATFTVAAYPDRRFDARVTLVHNGSRVVDRVVSYEAELAVDNRDLRLRPGMTATAEIVVSRLHDELVVPSQALRFDPPDVTPPKSPHVWVLRAGIPMPAAVKVVGENETHAAIHTTQIEPGELVIANTR